ncbi:MAG TPA: N-acetyl-gamma-glutamyl-phosphate reductase [Candidatus Omnitrophica bacterium]|nr:MAG: N-acetyl-gamma-glutamyl-phosphate reductase [Omnitrophica WOR_2 bacterium GWA2_53_43]HBO96941.1 N-acetyl-gamma-glutamyl-phosphate reductase [Candidatus Omnitrophota bacterium]HCI45254.1 N-acetyl-gamma-glutamyl-phosphate reductase [Candidatus Omnitrophota bacterium]
MVSEVSTVNVGIVGISGYSGGVALELLLNHPKVCVSYVSANNTRGKVSEIWPKLAGRTRLVCEPFDAAKAVKFCEVIFLAVPHTVSMQITPKLLAAGVRVIDLSGDYRLKRAAGYKKWYGADHADVPNLAKAVYGLPEFYREDIRKAKLISNPGCYPTAALLALAPLTTTSAKSIESIAIDAKSGVTGAGRKAKLPLSFGEVNENFKAYKPLYHQHVPEMELYLSKIAGKKITLDFVPHLLPVNYGILETIYVRLRVKTTPAAVHKTYTRFYKKEIFVRILDPGQQPELKNVVGTNYCDIGFAVSRDGRLVVVTSAIDNLYKGASGQAVQNMNIMCGFDEKEGLT